MKIYGMLLFRTADYIIFGATIARRQIGVTFFDHEISIADRIEIAIRGAIR